MNLLRIIKKNKELEPLFFQFMYWDIRLLAFEDQPKFKEDYTYRQTIIQEFQDAEKNLINRLVNLYKIPNSTETEQEQVIELIFSVCQYLDQKYGETFIIGSVEKSFAKTKKDLNFVPEPALDLTTLKRMLDHDSLICDKCQAKRMKMDFNDLPLGIQEDFTQINDMTEYYLYCKNCNQYSSMGFTEISEFNDN